MYNTTMFFQSVLLESAEKAGLRLIIPSVSFTAISAITATIIARTKTPAYTLRGGQFLIVIGTLGLLSMAVLSSSSSRTRIPDFVYNLVLIFPTLGVGMMAPSTVLALLNLSTKENHAIVNGGFIMTRSLGVFVAIALGTTTLQNVFEASIFQYGYDEATRKVGSFKKKKNSSNMSESYTLSYTDFKCFLDHRRSATKSRIDSFTE